MPTIDPELVQRLLRKLDALLPEPPPDIDFGTDWAFQWRRQPTLMGDHGGLYPVTHRAAIRFSDLHHIEHQADQVIRNTQHFVCGRPANNVLMTGARGTGKSSLVRACLTEFGAQGLRLIEVDRDHLADLPRLAERIHGSPHRFVVFCDDLSFEHGEPGYKALKSILDGGLSAQPNNLLIYATSNRRHLMPELRAENLQARVDESGELHPAESTEEKVSLSDRFGLWVSFRGFGQDAYLDIVHHWLAQLGVPAARWPEARLEALQWATLRGSRSGRVAAAFARDWAARHRT
ncbi:MAG: ATP-binding protein [Betaproteobacteria bacterium]|mgnify:CR=1 FL=1|jgi:predicted AAA+ superfamily ATPase|nr:ATP-binding protein [Betaproteobacteria bacterium]